MALFNGIVTVRDGISPPHHMVSAYPRILPPCIGFATRFVPRTGKKQRGCRLPSDDAVRLKSRRKLPQRLFIERRDMGNIKWLMPFSPTTGLATSIGSSPGMSIGGHAAGGLDNGQYLLPAAIPINGLAGASARL